MLIALWILNVLLALVFGSAGTLKLTQNKEQLRERGLAWTDDFSPAAIRTIGAVELIGAVGLIIPLLTGSALLVAPFAALVLAGVMGGAIFTHVRRGESPMPPIVLGLLALASTVLGTLVARS